jgi:hypothetical protein
MLKEQMPVGLDVGAICAHIQFAECVTCSAQQVQADSLLKGRFSTELSLKE